MKTLLVLCMTGIVAVGVTIYLSHAAAPAGASWRVTSETACCPATHDAQKLVYAMHDGTKATGTITQTDCFYQNGSDGAWGHSCWY